MRVLGLVITLGVVLAACGSSGSTTKSATTTSTTAASTTTTAASFTVSTATDPKLGVILVDAQGRTLYHNTKESGGTIACTGGCVGVWPVLSVPAGSTPAGPPGLPGRLATITRADGPTQVTYNGQPLYRYSGDTKAGATNGQGVGGIWFAETPAASAAAQTPAPTQAPVTTRAPAKPTPTTTYTQPGY
jgi:predicted lipoprotein with Yx(FWY)xxD motif